TIIRRRIKQCTDYRLPFGYRISPGQMANPRFCQRAGHTYDGHACAAGRSGKRKNRVARGGRACLAAHMVSPCEDSKRSGRKLEPTALSGKPPSGSPITPKFLAT